MIVLASALQDGERIIPVRAELKLYDNNPTALYMMIAETTRQCGVKLEGVKFTELETQSRYQLDVDEEDVAQQVMEKSAKSNDELWR